MVRWGRQRIRTVVAAELSARCSLAHGHQRFDGFWLRALEQLLHGDAIHEMECLGLVNVDALGAHGVNP